ncbi:hypothetical protein HF072_00695 [Bacillus sp. RO3]|nr:hypothetical protein [Bacillus sp. RO3]
MDKKVRRISLYNFRKATTQQLLQIIQDEKCPKYEKCRAHVEIVRRNKEGILSFSSGETA